jgi:hypothetical protein
MSRQYLKRAGLMLVGAIRVLVVLGVVIWLVLLYFGVLGLAILSTGLLLFLAGALLR